MITHERLLDVLHYIEAARKAREDAEINLHGVMARTM